jgi:DNA-binding transcriptional regulator YdaS (Cro superfamily)
MEKLLRFLNALQKSERLTFCDAIGSSERYLRKAVSAKQKLGAELCIKIEQRSARSVVCEDLRPDVDWAYLRGTALRTDDAANQFAE